MTKRTFWYAAKQKVTSFQPIMGADQGDGDKGTNVLSIVEKIFGVFAPHLCVLCGREGQLLCVWCREDGLVPVPSRCYRCHKLSRDSRTCDTCRATSKLGHVWVRAEYEQAAKQLVHEMKFNFAQAAAKEIAQVMAETLPYLPESTMFVHIPTATKHVRERGFDHAALIARELSKLTDRPHVNLLARSGQARQVGAKRAERLTQMRDVFRGLQPTLIKGAHIVLVDDVLTTGGTLEAAARVLRTAGARHVDAVVFAQAR